LAVERFQVTGGYFFIALYGLTVQQILFFSEKLGFIQATRK
jgi:hypothetical protein